MFAKCLLRRFDSSLGEGIMLFVVMALCVSGVSVYMLLRLLVSLQSLERLVLYVMVLRICFHLVCCLCWMSSDISLSGVFFSVDDIRCGELVSEVVPFADFVSDESMESGAIMFHSPGWDMLFTAMYDGSGEVFCGCVYVSEVVYVELCECCVNVVGKAVPVCSFVISVSTFGGGVKGTVKCVCDD